MGYIQGRIQDFKLGGAHLKKLRRPEEGANILGVFRVKNHYFTPKISFYNYGGRREKFWGISCEKSRFYAKKTYFFPILGGGAPPPLDPPLIYTTGASQLKAREFTRGRDWRERYFSILFTIWMVRVLTPTKS
jgi:hypothetical protein